MKVVTVAIALSFSLITGCSREEQQPPVVVFSASGNINSKLDEFRDQLGELNTTTGQTSGRREVNWDGVPDDMAGLKLPGNFFNPTAPGSPEGLQRGLLYGGDADAIVSRTAFAEVNTQAVPEFENFSGDKSFAVVNATVWPVEFRVAGEQTVATVNGFGAVFTDVDKSQSTFLEFFDNNKSIGRYYVPAHDQTSRFSFLGVYFQNQQVTSVNIGHEGKLIDGQKDITQGGNSDLVVLDDFIYSEPRRK